MNQTLLLQQDHQCSEAALKESGDGRVETLSFFGRPGGETDGGEMGSQDENSQWQEPCGQGHLRSSTSNNIAGSSSLMMKYCLVRMCNNKNSGKSDPYLRVSQDSVPLHTTTTVGFTPNVFPQDYHEIGFCHYSLD